MYPMWIKVNYQEDGITKGYTGSATSRNDLIQLFIRLDIYPHDITNFEINSEKQPEQVLHRLFVEIQKEREGDSGLKQGKKPTNKQKAIIKQAGLRPDNWLVTKNLQHELHIVNRTSNKERIITI